MAHLTQREAARAWSIPWTTFRRKVQAGELSIGADKRVDPAEMVRVFGEPRTSTNGPSGPSPGPAEETPEVARLKAENEGLRAVISAKDETIRTQADALLRLAGPKADPQPEQRADPEPGLDPTSRRVLWLTAVAMVIVFALVAFDVPSLIRL